MSATNSLHYELCCKGATWIRQPKNREPWQSAYCMSVVELVTLSAENPDIYATNGVVSCNIEVKTSHNDFVNDKKKISRIDNKYAIGDFRYYLCPEGVISPCELPPNWGLLYYDGKKIRKVVQAEYQPSEKIWDMLMLTSIMRREGILGKTLNYRHNAANFEDNLENCEK